MLFAVVLAFLAVLAGVARAWYTGGLNAGSTEINRSVIGDSCGVVSRVCFYFGEVGKCCAVLSVIAREGKG